MKKCGLPILDSLNKSKDLSLDHIIRLTNVLFKINEKNFDMYKIAEKIEKNLKEIDQCKTALDDQNNTEPDWTQISANEIEKFITEILDSEDEEKSSIWKKHKTLIICCSVGGVLVILGIIGYVNNKNKNNKNKNKVKITEEL